MNPRPVIFVSAVSGELKTARGFASRLLHSLGFDPKDQDMAASEHGSLRAVLRKWIDQSAGVIQLVGARYGREPVHPDGTPNPDPEFGRCSYTQFEARYALQTGKPVWYFFTGDGFTPDDSPGAGAPRDPESPDLAALQARYVADIRAAGDVRHTFASDTELEVRIRRIQDRLDELRRAWQDEQRRARRFRIFAGVGIVLLLALGIAGVQLGWWVKKDAAQARDTAGRTEKKVDALTQATTEFIQRNAADTASSGGKDDATRRTFLFAELEKKHGLPAGTLERELPDIARKRAEDAAIPKIERAKAAEAALDYAEAERLALEAYAEAKKAVPLDKHKLIEALELAGLSASAHRDDKTALTHFTDASKLTDKAADPLEWARVHHALAFALEDHGEAARAAALLPEVIAIRKGKLGAEHPDTLGSQENLGIALWAQGKNAEAEAEYRALLPIQERVLGAEHHDTLGNRNNLALVLNAQGKSAKAEAEYRAVLAIMQRVLGAEHPHTLAIRSNLADALSAQGKNAEAEAEHRACIAIEERVLGAEHPDTLMSWDSLANVLQAQGKNAEAEAEHRVVLAIRERVLGAEHPETLRSRMGLANALYVQGKYPEAEAEHRAVLAIKERVLDAEHPSTLMSRNNLALALHAQGKHVEAEAKYRALLPIQERVLGAEHPDTLSSRNNLAGALREQGKNAEAEAEHRAVLAIRERVLGAEHPDVARSCYDLTLCLDAQGRKQEALDFARRALEGWRKALGAEHPYTKYAQALVTRLSGEGKGGGK